MTCSRRSICWKRGSTLIIYLATAVYATSSSVRLSRFFTCRQPCHVSTAAGIQYEPLAEKFTSATICLRFTPQGPDKADALPCSPERGFLATGHQNSSRKYCSGPHDTCSKQQAAQHTCTVSVVLKVAALMVTSQWMLRAAAHSYWKVWLGAAACTSSALMPASHSSAASALRSFSRPPPPRAHTSTSACAEHKESLFLQMLLLGRRRWDGAGREPDARPATSAQAQTRTLPHPTGSLLPSASTLTGRPQHLLQEQCRSSHVTSARGKTRPRRAL